MGGRSPFYGQTQQQKLEVARRLRERYGDEIVVRTAYGIDPFPQVTKQTPHAVVRSLVRDEGVTHLAVAEHFSVISDSMSTFHLRKHVEHALHQLGERIPVAYADQLGGRDAFNRGVVLKVKEELEELPRDAKVALFLSNHGFPLTKMGRYDARKDRYHQNVKTVYESAKAAVEEEIRWEGELAIFQVFGQFTEPKYNPGGAMLSPLRAIDIVASRGFEYAVDIRGRSRQAQKRLWLEAIAGLERKIRDPLQLQEREGQDHERPLPPGTLDRLLLPGSGGGRGARPHPPLTGEAVDAGARNPFKTVRRPAWPISAPGRGRYPSISSCPSGAQHSRPSPDSRAD
ncbi:MAG: ferrochelatase, partial [Candidatus Bathyarchaeia archaeon]